MLDLQAKFLTKTQPDARLHDIMADRSDPLLRQGVEELPFADRRIAMAGIALGTDVDAALALAVEVRDAYWMVGRNIPEGVAWLAHLRATSRHRFQRALIEVADGEPLADRDADLDWFVRELELRVFVAEEARRRRLVGTELMRPDTERVRWTGVGPSPYSARFVPAGWSAEEWYSLDGVPGADEDGFVDDAFAVAGDVIVDIDPDDPRWSGDNDPFRTPDPQP